MPDKARLYELLEHQRQVVTAVDVGEMRKEESWAVVDFLLDRLCELNNLPVDYDSIDISEL